MFTIHSSFVPPKDKAMSRFLRIMVVVLALTGCASGEKKLEVNAVPSESLGYVAGDFTSNKPPFAAAFVLRHIETGQEFVLPFTKLSNFPAGHRETSMVALPRGTYRATHWLVFHCLFGANPGGTEFKAELKPSRFSEQFKLEGGEVVFLGRFVTESQWTYGYYKSSTHGRFEAQRISTADAHDLMLQSYPKFTGSKFTCLTCVPAN